MVMIFKVGRYFELMACIIPSYEKRPLKRPRLGPPDFYPQDAKQKEDELTADKLKQGFLIAPLFRDFNEYDSAREKRTDSVAPAVKPEIQLPKIASAVNAVLAKKHELNALQDIAKKKLGIGAKDVGFWHVSLKPKADAWFKDLAGSKPLLSLAKRVPIFNKKEEIFQTLCEFQIPMSRAVWFIKLAAAYSTMQQETGKVKKRQTNDSYLEWTTNLCRFLRDSLLGKLSDFHSISSQQQPIVTQDIADAQKQWQYCCRLARSMDESGFALSVVLLQEGLLDRQAYLNALLEIFIDKCRNNDEGVLRLLLPLALQHMNGFVQSEILSRKLAVCCAKKLANMYYESTESSSPCSPSNPGSSSPSNWYSEYLCCPLHRYLVFSLSAIIQVILAECPEALIWNNLGSGSTDHSSGLCGSALDLLPCAPSALPMPSGTESDLIRKELVNKEDEIRSRSIAVEIQWSSDKCQQSGMGTTVQQVLAILDVLDKHRFDRVDENTSLENLYWKIFPATRDADEANENEKLIIKLLCQWAVTSLRHGSHRASIVAHLLQKRQQDTNARTTDAMEALTPDSQQAMEQEPASSDFLRLYPFQKYLLEFLDTESPGVEGSNNLCYQFSQLIYLFAELVRLDVFSHSQYMATLIARGDVQPANAVSSSAKLGGTYVSSSGVKGASRNEGATCDFMDTKDPDDTGVDLSHLVASITESTHAESSQQSAFSNNRPLLNSQSNHHCYLSHLPLPQTEEYRSEANERNVMLYGFGIARDQQRHLMRKMSKELFKLWHRKNCLNVSEGFQSRPKKKLSNETLSALTAKFKQLPIYDQCQLVENSVYHLIEQLETACGNSTGCYRPTHESIDYLLGLIESTNSFSVLVYLGVEVMKLLKSIEQSVRTRSSSAVFAEFYVQNLAVCLVGFLRRHHSYLILNEKEASSIFCSLHELMKNKDPCYIGNSAEKCLWLYLYHLFHSCNLIKKKYTDFESEVPKIRQWLQVQCDPSRSSLKWDADALKAYIENPKKPIDEETLRTLHDPQVRYSFVVTALTEIADKGQDKDRSRDLCLLFCDLTVLCPALSSDWLGALRALCCTVINNPQNSQAMPPQQQYGFTDLLSRVGVNDPNFSHQLCLVYGFLVGRHCVRLEDFVQIIALPSLVVASKTICQRDTVAEAGARLTLHLIGTLFCVTHKQGVSFGGTQKFKLLSDNYLLCAAHLNIVAEALMSLLMIMLILAETKIPFAAPPKAPLEPSLSEILGTATSDSPSSDTLPSEDASNRSGSLSALALDILVTFSSQEWMRNKLMQEPENLFTSKFLLSRNITPAQAGKLLRLLTRGESESQLVLSLDKTTRFKDVVAKLLGSLSIWNLRASLLELKLFHRQAEQNDQSRAQELNKVTEAVARCCLDLFQNNSDQERRYHGSATKAGCNINPVWLVAPLVSQLSKEAQGRILKVAADVLEKDRSSWQKNSWLLSEQPFLSLVLTCLRGQDEQREPLLNNLQKQLQQYVVEAKQDPTMMYDIEKASEIQEALQLRLSLVGGMFETVCRSSYVDQWALLLLQMILYNVVSPSANQQLYFTCLDMLSVLIHSTLVWDSERIPEDAKRNYNKVMKALRKEAGERNCPRLWPVHRLLPLPRCTVDVIAVEPYGTCAAKGSSKSVPSPSVITDSNRQGLQVSEKRRLSPWEVVEARNGALSWSYFRAVRLDTIPDPVTAKLIQLLPHEHYYIMKRPSHPGDGKPNWFLEPFNVPYESGTVPEDDAQTTEEKTTDITEHANSPQSTSGNRSGPKSKKSVSTKVQRNSSSSKTGAPVVNIQAGRAAAPAVAGSVMYPNLPNAQAFNPGNMPVQSTVSNVYMHQQPQQMQFPQRLYSSGGAKSVLSHVIRNRQPSGNVMNTQSGSGHVFMQQPQMMTENPNVQMEMNRQREMLLQEGMIQQGTHRPRSQMNAGNMQFQGQQVNQSGGPFTSSYNLQVSGGQMPSQQQRYMVGGAPSSDMPVQSSVVYGPNSVLQSGHGPPSYMTSQPNVQAAPNMRYVNPGQSQSVQSNKQMVPQHFMQQQYGTTQQVVFSQQGIPNYSQVQLQQRLPQQQYGQHP